MLELAAGLSSGVMTAIAELEREVTEFDGGRLKLEWGRLRNRSGDRVEDVLWWDHDRLVGFLGLYGYGSSLELAGMVAPDARRQGIAGALLDGAAPLYRGRPYRQVLLIVPRLSVAGRQLALHRGAGLHHSEHALVLAGALAGGSRDPALSLRPAVAMDLPSVVALLEAGFGEPVEISEDELDSPRGRTLVVERSGSVVGTLRVSRDGNDARISGFVVDPRWQARGIGREVLRRACEQLRAGGAGQIGLEVAVDNDRALALYTSVGFAPVTTEDYFALPMN